jgi:transglutaminase-like putative cysteine protease
MNTFPPLPSLQWLLFALSLVVLPHLSHIHWWVSGTFVLLVVWRYLYARDAIKLPPQWLQFALSMALFVGVFLSYGTIFGKEAGVSLLIALLGFKLLELQQMRDAFILCLLGYFLVITNFLYSQSFSTALYMGFIVIIMTATLNSLNEQPQQLNLKKRLYLSTKIILQSIPMMLVLFFLFPRITTNFWSLPKDAYQGVSGLSESMKMGNINELSLSDEVAFRVKFQGKPPPPKQLYWRGPVLWWTDGTEWKSGYQQEITQYKPVLAVSGQSYQYEMTLEPHNQRWLLALDIPQNVQASKELRTYISSDFQLLSMLPIRQLTRYTAESFPEYKMKDLAKVQRQMALRLPEGKHPKTREFAKQWVKQGLTPEIIVQQALQYFRQQAFYYSLTPPLLTGDSVDEFLFNTREGFCEHYAAAFTVLMRAAGIPSRVVTGYLGGEINEMGEYMLVRQRDAHAWSEVWLEGQGWVRIDPTGAVAPERINSGIDTALPQQYSPLGMSLEQSSSLVQMWQEMRRSFDALNYGWKQWVLGYNTERQNQFLNNIGLGSWDWQQLGVLLIALLATLFSAVATWLWMHARYLPKDPAQRLYLKLCHRLAKHQLSRHASEGAWDFAARVGTARPDLSGALQEITELYTQIRYRNQAELLPLLKQRIRGFKP